MHANYRHIQTRRAQLRPARWFARLIAILALLFSTGLVSATRPTGVAAASAETIRRFDTTERVVVLTFDAGSDRGYADAILDTLSAEHTAASFGMTGSFATANPDVVARIVRDGHHLLNHTWDHKSFTGYSTGTAPLTAAERADELRRTADLVRAQTGVTLDPYFRPPYGDYDNSVLADIAANGYTYSIMWTIDSLGWQGLSAAQITARVLAATVPGAIVLMHVGGQSQDAAALPGMISQLRARGYRFATVRDFLPAPYTFPQTGHSLGGRFLDYWEANGGLAQFGFPLTEPFSEQNADDGKTYTVQYFERQRYEWHPENIATPYDVLLGRVGVDDARRRGLLGTAPFQPLPANTGSDANCTFVATTGHRLCFSFRAYWQSHGLQLGETGISYRESLALFGYPISEEFRMRLEDGREYTVQYFERARLEYHPENRPPYDVLLGQLGRAALVTSTVP